MTTFEIEELKTGDVIIGPSSVERIITKLGSIGGNGHQFSVHCGDAVFTEHQLRFFTKKEIPNTECPGCGRGMRSAMSGAHIPYEVGCDDCGGSGRVTETKAKEIKDRHNKWLKRQTSK